MKKAFLAQFVRLIKKITSSDLAETSKGLIRMSTSLLQDGESSASNIQNT